MELPPNYTANKISINVQSEMREVGIANGNATRKSAEYSRATYLRNQNLVTGGNAHGEALAILVKGTGTNGENLGLVLLLNAALREEDAGGGLGLGLDALDQNAVQKGSEVLDVAEDRLLRKELVYSADRESG